MRQVAADNGMIVIMVLHDLVMAARWSDRVVLLAEGRIAADGAPSDAITAERLGEVYRVAATVENSPRGLSIVIDDIL
ncbi:MAG: hypothetical protein DI637_13805 [Citromicrobium sp.]|nr:MAG: hypothetical protein DI637_13805 [Citromicrobium sp.]